MKLLILIGFVGFCNKAVTIFVNDDNFVFFPIFNPSFFFFFLIALIRMSRIMLIIVVNGEHLWLISHSNENAFRVSQLCILFDNIFLHVKETVFHSPSPTPFFELRLNWKKITCVCHIH